MIITILLSFQCIVQIKSTELAARFEGNGLNSYWSKYSLCSFNYKCKNKLISTSVKNRTRLLKILLQINTFSSIVRRKISAAKVFIKYAFFIFTFPFRFSNIRIQTFSDTFGGLTGAAATWPYHVGQPYLFYYRRTTGTNATNRNLEWR